MQRLTTVLDVLGALGLAIAAGFAIDWTAGLAVASVLLLLASWQLATPRKPRR